MKIEVRKKYELNNGEVHECTHMHGDEHDNVLLSWAGCGPFVINDVLYHQDGRFASADADHEYSVKREWIEHKTGTLAELDVKPGDVVELVQGITNMYQGHTYTIQQDGKILDNNGSGQYYGFVDDFVDGICYDVTFRIISRASDIPKTWGDDEGWSEWTSDADWDTSKVDVQMECIDGIHRTRTRPRKPVRKTVVTYSGNPSEGHWGPDNDDDDTHRITFTTTDGNPDLDSIKMEALG